MSDQAELAFVKNFTNIIASQPVTFDNDFQEEPEKTLKRVPVLQVCANRFPRWTMCNWARHVLGRCSPSPRVEKER
jgi:hypothetical protein